MESVAPEVASASVDSAAIALPQRARPIITLAPIRGSFVNFLHFKLVNALHAYP